MRRARADQEEEDPVRTARPQKGDLLVHVGGSRDGQVVKPEDLTEGGPQVLAWALDPVKKVPRDGSRLNQVLLVRLAASAITNDEKPHAAQGVIAFSAICTHAQCTVTDWLANQGYMQCPCHQSEYDPRRDATVVAGPAPRPLPPLPLMIAGGELRVAGPFIGRVGGQPQGGT